MNQYDYAAMGCYVFPCVPMEKKPLVKWKKESTTDPLKIAAWEIQYPGCNWAMDCEKSNKFVIDQDPEGMVWVNPWPTDFITQTPRKGYHYVYEGLGRTTSGKIQKGIDTRGVGGYVLIPPSRTADGIYTLHKNGRPTPTPGCFHGAGTSESRTPMESDLGSDTDLAAAVEWLKRRDPAIQGDGGDIWTYKTLALLKDMGCSGEQVFEIIWEWNERCLPPWEPEDLRQKIRNVFKYGKLPPGIDALENVFPKERRPEKTDSFFVDLKDLLDLESRVNWLVKGILEKDTIVIWFGKFASFKSFLVMDLCLALAAGQEWAGKKLEKGRAVYLQGEGKGGTSRRMKAMAKKRGLAGAEGFKYTFSKFAIDLSDETVARGIIDRVKGKWGGCDLLVIDTLASNFGSGDENATKDMNRVLANLIRIKEALKCVVVVLHHSGLIEEGRSRGSSILEAGADAVYQISGTKERMACLHSPRKMKDAEPGPDLWFRLNPIVVGVDEETLEEVTSLAPEWVPDYQPPASLEGLGANQRLIVQLVKEGKSDLTELIEAYKTIKGDRYDNANFHRTLIKLKEKGVISTNGGGLTHLTHTDSFESNESGRKDRKTDSFDSFPLGDESMSQSESGG